MAKREKSTTNDESVNAEAQILDEVMQSLPKEDREFLNEVGVKTFDDLNSLLMLAGIDPAKAYKHATESDSFEEYMTKDLLLDRDFDKVDADVQQNYFARVFFHKRDNVKEYHIRIKLKDSPVKIWRELKVPSNISLELLAAFIIEAMGWGNCHLHQFMKNDICFMSEEDFNETDDMLGGWGRFQNVDANNYSLGDVLEEKGARMKFEYDFGDSWVHEMWVKGIRDYEPGEQHVVKLIKGHGACPPEDCGGVWGYEDLLALREKKRKSAEDKERLEWYYMDDKDFDPEYYDLELEADVVNNLWQEVETIMSPKKKRSKRKN